MSTATPASAPRANAIRKRHFDSPEMLWYRDPAMVAPIPHEALARATQLAFGAGTRITAVEPLSGDASTRRYLRLRLAGGEAATAVAMLLGEGRFLAGSDELGGAGAIEELPFLNVARYLSARGFPVPAVHADASREDGLLLLEDVGDLTLWAAARAAPARTSDLFGAAVELLVQLQVAGARHPDPACYAFRRRFDEHLARSELDHFVEHGIETRHGRSLPSAERAALANALAPVAASFETEALVLSHRDFMAWNLHVQAGQLRLIDFQDALLAPDTYDLAALLTDRTTGTLLTPAIEAALLRRFETARAAAGLPVGGDIVSRYRLSALHRALKVIGRFSFLERVQKKPGYLAYLPAVYAVARRMLGALPELAPLHAHLATHVPELATNGTG